jgi:uncharacterized protein YeeX (DUF496 family)
MGLFTSKYVFTPKKTRMETRSSHSARTNKIVADLTTREGVAEIFNTPQKRRQLLEAVKEYKGKGITRANVKEITTKLRANRNDRISDKHARDFERLLLTKQGRFKQVKPTIPSTETEKRKSIFW